PKEHPSTFAVAALSPGGQVAEFSSRGGPGVQYQGRQIPKPDISAPGVNIRSSVPGGGYASMSGTSMAAPHVTGATALLYQIDPSLTPLQVKSILISSARPAGASMNSLLASWNPDHGYGNL